MFRFLVAALTVFACSLAVSSQEAPRWVPSTIWSASHIECPDELSWPELEKRALEGSIEAEGLYGAVLLSKCRDGSDPAVGVKYLREAAKKANVHAALTLGEAYRDGHGTEKDPVEAAKWFQKAADAGDTNATNDIGVAYFLGEGVTKDYAKALKFFLEAAKKGSNEAAFNAAAMYDLGQGVTRDYGEARSLYGIAALQKNLEAEYRLGMMCEEGLGGEKDAAGAKTWFEKAADDGSDDAAVRIGRKHPSELTSVSSGYFQWQAAVSMLYGKESDRDIPRAILFLEKAVAAGCPQAMLELGNLYEYGRGTPKDEKKAEEFFLKAIGRDPKYHVGFNNLAWLYVTADDLKLRNNKKAVELATHAVELSEEKVSFDFDTLAHAYFALGDIDRALEAEKKAADLAPTDDYVQKTLLEYKSAKEKKNTSR